MSRPLSSVTVGWQVTAGYWRCAAPQQCPARMMLKGVLFFELRIRPARIAPIPVLPAARRSNVLPERVQAVYTILLHLNDVQSRCKK